MAPLTNVRQEIFCLQAIQGKPDIESYTLAGYKGDPAKCASKVRHRPAVKARILELQELAADEEIMQLKERKLRLSRLGRVEIGHYMDGNGYYDQTKIAEGQGVVSFKRTPTLYGFSEELKIHDPLGPIKELNAIDQIYDENPSQKAGVIFNVNVINSEAADLVRRALAGEGT